MSYQITYLWADGRTKTATYGNAPKDHTLGSSMVARGSCAAVIRYWPSKRGWRVATRRDMTSFQRTSLNTVHKLKWSKAVYPSEDAAVMTALVICRKQLQETTGT